MNRVLDHGYVKQIESWGSDERIIESAQWEIRQFADAVEAEIKRAFPRTHALFLEGKPL